MRTLLLPLLLAACSAGAGNAGNQVANGAGPAAPPGAPPPDRCASGDEEHLTAEAPTPPSQKRAWRGPRRGDAENGKRQFAADER